ncbi:MAG: ABC transporter substrate-binding protein [Alphaproteobacteria bacterium]|nr:ABC transporter substrate-binding protein [Alphaproteobacteria bacterium]
MFLAKKSLAFLTLVCLAGAAMPTWAQTADKSARTHEQAMTVAEGRFIQDLGDRAIKIVADKKLDEKERNKAFGNILSDSFDLKTIGRFVIGRTWRVATDAQKDEYMNLFKALVIRNYGKKIALYTNEGFVVVGTRPETDRDTVVLSQITHPDGSPATEIDWRVRTKNGKSGVIDIVVEGVSLSITQKQEYASVIQNNGGKIEGLLDVMRKQLDTPQDE